MLSDTHPDAERVQLELVRNMTVAERLSLAASWTRMAVSLSRQSLAEANPDLNEQELRLLWIERQYGKDLAERVRIYLLERAMCKDGE